MMPVVRISDATWTRLKQHARPFEDSPEDIIKLALDALDQRRGTPIPDEQVAKTRKSRPAGSKLPQAEFEKPLLEVLIMFGGSAAVSDIRKAILPRVAKRLKEADYENVSTGDPRWWNATCWARNDLVKQGLLKSDSPRGIWQLTEQGRTAASA